MAAARYWRLVGIETYGYRADLELSEVRLLEGATDVTVTPTSTVAPESGSLANLSDSDTGTTCRFAGGDVAQPGFGLYWDFGSGVSKDVTEIRLSAASSKETFAYRVTVSASTDGLTWYEVLSIAGISYQGALNHYPVYLADDYSYPSVSLLLHGDGADNSTVITDSSPSARSATVYGNAKISTAQSKFGGASIRLDGAGDYITFPNSSAFDLSTGDFTIEAWLYLNTAAGGNLCGIRDNATGWQIPFALTGGKLTVTWQQWTSGGAYTPVSCTDANATTGFAYVAIVRRSGVVTVIVNDTFGVPTAVGTGSFTTKPLTIGVDATSFSDYFDGYIDELRITKGVARAIVNKPFAPFQSQGLSGPALVDRKLTGTSSLFSIGSTSIGNTQIKAVAPITAHDREDFGFYRVTGTVTEKALPSNSPLRRRVRLHRENDGRLIREVWSDATTGEYAFNYIRGDAKYTVVTYDYTNSYRAVIADNITPDPMP